MVRGNLAATFGIDPTERLVKEFVDNYYIFELLVVMIFVAAATWISTLQNRFGDISEFFLSFPSFPPLPNLTQFYRMEMASDSEYETEAPSSYQSSRVFRPILCQNDPIVLNNGNVLGDHDATSVQTTSSATDKPPHNFSCTRSGRPYKMD